MTQELNQATGRWQVSAQGNGEVLVVRVELEGAVLVWAGPHQDADPESVGVILRAAAVFAREATRRERRSLPIPAMLYHLMSRLIAGDVPRRWPNSCVAVMLDSSKELGFGLLGEAEQQAWMGGHPVQLPWVRLVQRGGGDARAYRLQPDQDAKVRWSWSRKDVAGQSAIIEASRPSETSMEMSGETMVEASVQAPMAPAPVAAPEVTPEPEFEPTSSLQQAEDMMAAPPVIRERRSEPMITSQMMEPEAPSAMPAMAAAAAPVEEAPAPPPPPRRLRLEERPQSPPPAKRSRLFGLLDRFMGDSDREEMAERIPPPPEPESVTARAVAPLPREAPAVAPSAEMHERAMAAAPAFVQDNVIPMTASPEQPAIREHAVLVEKTGTGGEVDVTPDPAMLPVPRRAHPMPPLRPRSARYETENDDDDETPMWKKPWVIGVGVLVLIVAVFGMMQMFGKRSGGGMFAGSTYALAVTSDPAGAGIQVDGKDTPKITPATLALSPGKHQVTLTLPGRGSATYDSEGRASQKLTLEADLHGSLNIEADDPKVPVSIAVDGVDKGYAPITVEQLEPGPHEVRFSAPGSAPWSETFDLSIGQKYEMVARSMAEPGSGIASVRGVVIGADGEDDATGAEVWVDGERRGMAPLTLELASGPHSFRARYQGEDAPVQVVDLPGGNQRFIQFRFGLGLEMPKLVSVTSPGGLPTERPAVVSCYLTGIPETDLAEMWLHVKAPNGNWRRYAMVPMKATGGIVGTAVFPAVMLDPNGKAPHYMSAVTRVGDEYYTEIFWQTARRRTAATQTSANEPGGE